MWALRPMAIISLAVVSLKIVSAAGLFYADRSIHVSHLDQFHSGWPSKCSVLNAYRNFLNGFRF